MKLLSAVKISETYFRNKKRFKLQIFTVFSLMFFLLFFVLTFSSTFHSTIKKVFSTDNNTFITIIPEEMDIAYFKFKKPSFLGKGNLNEDDIEYLESLKGVTQVSPLFTLDAPAKMSGKLFDMAYGTDLSVFGETRPFKGIWYSKKNTDKVRAVVSSKLMDIYNSSFAPANDLPKMTEKILIGRRFNLTVGSNSFKNDGNSHTMKVTVVGLDEDVPFLGITLPQTVLEKIAGIIGSSTELASIKVYFDSSADMIRISEIISDKGYRILENENDIFKTINKYISKIDIFLFFPIAFIIFVIVLFVQNQIRYMLLHLKKEIGVQMALGTYYNDIIKIWLYQYIKYIFYGLVCGSGISFILIRIMLALNSGSVLSKMIRTEYNIVIYALMTAVLSVAGIFYIYLKIRGFLKQNSIVKLMTND